MLGRFVGADTLLFGFASAESERIMEELPLKFLLTKVENLKFMYEVMSLTLSCALLLFMDVVKRP